MNFSTIFKTAIIISSLVMIVSCSDDDPSSTGSNGTAGKVAITFDAKVGSQDFALDTEYAINGHDYSFDHLRYWVSNVVLVKEDGTEVAVADSYYLLEETGEISVQDGSYIYPAKKREVVQLSDIPQGRYTKLRFAVGVDPTYNDNLSLQSGELSQLNGMTNISWMWHTSYIFSSLSGVSHTNEEIKVETGLNTNFRNIEIALPSGVNVGNGVAKINLGVDVARIVDNIDLHETPVISADTPAEMANVANNFRDKVFLLTGVE